MQERGGALFFRFFNYWGFAGRKKACHEFGIVMKI
jgi:hypothetical protein